MSARRHGVPVAGVARDDADDAVAAQDAPAATHKNTHTHTHTHNIIILHTQYYNITS